VEEKQMNLEVIALGIIYSLTPILFAVGMLLLWNREKPKKKDGWKGDDCQ